MGTVQKGRSDFEFQKRVLGKPVLVHRSLFWLLHFLIWGVYHFPSSSFAAAPSFMALYVLSPLLLWLVLSNLFYLKILNKYFIFCFTVSVVSENLFLLFMFPPRTSSPIYFCRGHFRQDDLLWVTCKPLLCSSWLLVYRSLLETLSLQKDRGKQEYCTLRKNLSVIQC